MTHVIVGIQGIFISKVNPGGAADKAGLTVADKLLSVSKHQLIDCDCVCLSVIVSVQRGILDKVPWCLALLEIWNYFPLEILEIYKVSFKFVGLVDEFACVFVVNIIYSSYISELWIQNILR